MLLHYFKYSSLFFTAYHNSTRKSCWLDCQSILKYIDFKVNFFDIIVAILVQATIIFLPWISAMDSQPFTCLCSMYWAKQCFTVWIGSCHNFPLCPQWLLTKAKVLTTAAAAKLLQSCLTLCDPIDSSQPGPAVPAILQARTLEWVAISSSNAWKWKVKVKSLSRVPLLATPWTAAHQAPPSMGFSRQEYWSGVPLPSPS